MKETKENLKKTNKKTEGKIDKKIKKEEVLAEDEKELFSVNLLAIVALLILLAVIVCTMIYMYYKPSPNVKEKSNTIQEKEDMEQNIVTSKTPVPFVLDDQIKIVKEYLGLRAIAKANPQSLLEKLGLATTEQFAVYKKNTEETFIQTDISYETIRDILQKYITKEFFFNEFKNIYKQSNGITHVAIINDTQETYRITRYEELETKGRPIIQVWYETTKDDVTSNEKMMKVGFSTYNGRWIISDIK